MLNMKCPACQAQCQVDEKFRGRKIKCPKCGTRVRHLPDGNFELLSMGQVPPPAPVPPPATPGAPPAGEAPPPSAPVPVISSLAGQSESTQNTVVVLVVIHLFALGILALGFAIGHMPIFASVFALTLLITWIVFMSKHKKALRIERANEETSPIPLAAPVPGAPVAPASAPPAPAAPAPAVPAPAVPAAAPPAPPVPVPSIPPAAAAPAPAVPAVPPPAAPAAAPPAPATAPPAPAPAAPPAPIDPGANVSSTDKTEPIPKV
jgi:hypothetical protein